MNFVEWIRLILGTVFLFAGLFVVITSVIGIFRFNVVMNRMQSAALGDTMGLFLSLCGLLILHGFSPVFFKFLLIILLLWLTSPVTSHLILKMELYTYGENWDKETEKQDEEEIAHVVLKEKLKGHLSKED